MLPPLSEQMRPQTLQEIVGQEALVGEQGFIQKTVERKSPLSILLWGPPGTGKTSIARLYHPKERGFERELIKRMNYFKTLRNRLKGVDSSL